mmetsp:Transcript_16472/g.41665  ORF Transcript_16472/g.41665 Transcript_16472/m.41665 type:complete len:209 (-) Transcript_16472:902-1528(-)
MATATIPAWCTSSRPLCRVSLLFDGPQYGSVGGVGRAEEFGRLDHQADAVPKPALCLDRGPQSSHVRHFTSAPTVAGDPSITSPSSCGFSASMPPSQQSSIRRLPSHRPRSSTASRNCCCQPMTLPGRISRRYPMASRALKPSCLIMCNAISVPVLPTPSKQWTATRPSAASHISRKRSTMAGVGGATSSENSKSTNCMPARVKGEGS